jgi:Ca-activated chloride channel homolog
MKDADVSARAGGSGLGRRGRSRRVGTAKLVALAIGVSAICMITMAANAVIHKASCSNTPVLVNVAVSYDIAPAIQTVARAFNKQNVTAGGHCVEVQVTAGQSAAEASQIDGQASLGGMAPIDAWIPDSTLWVDVARTYPLGAQDVQPTGKSVARSPLMLVTTAAVEATTRVFEVPPSWSVLLPPSYGGPPASLGVAVDLPDPTDSASGLATLIELTRVLGDSAAARTAITKFVFNAESTENFDSAGALEEFAQTTEPPVDRDAVTIASEQAVIAYDKANPKAPLVARYPGGASAALGSPELDYPYVLTTANSARLQGATAFGNFLQTNYVKSMVRYYGFRSPNGIPGAMPAAAGLSSQALQLASAPSASEAASNLEAWEKLGLGSRDLALVDVSRAMNQLAAPGTSLTLEQELSQTDSRGLGLFPDSTSMGLWEMGQSSSASTPDKPLISIGPLTADYGVVTRRTALEQLTYDLKAGSGVLALHDAILAAYKQMTDTYTPNYSNAVLVLTSGVDSARGDMSLSSLVSKLHSLYNPGKKVEIVVLMVGTQGNLSAMQQIASATDGAAYQITNPLEIGKIFIEAISQRLCTQGCAAP